MYLLPRLPWTICNCPKRWKIAGADDGDEEIARIFENENSRNPKWWISRLTFYPSIRIIVYIGKIFNWMSNKCVFID